MAEIDDVPFEPADSASGVPADQVSADDLAPGRLAKGAAKVVRDWVIVIALALFAAFVVRTFLLQQFYISGPSMETTLYQNNRVLVNKLSYRFSNPGRGDVVVFDRVSSSGSSVVHDDLIKRIIALENETIEIKQCVVYINEEPLSEKYLDEYTRTEEDLTARCRTPDMHAVTVPDNHVFVMGDNRSESFDSRSFGPIEESKIVGRAFAVVWPLSNLKLL
jgi:signal peptidase I